MQTLLIPTFHYALKPGGILLLSPSESIDSHNSDIFTPLSRKWKIYQAANSPASVRTVMLSSLSHTAVNRGGSEETMKKVKETNFAELTKQVLLQSYAPASVVTDLSGGILYVHGDTSKYLRPAPGQATLNVLEMARDGLQLDLRAALHNAASQGTPTTSRELSIKVHGSSELMSFSVSRMPDPDGGEGLLLISFHDVQQTRNRKPARGKRAMASVDFQRVAEVELELNRTRENLQAIIEEQQASNEELKSANEEMQSTNEELQSINEELETSKEELQSLNEELANVNAELNVKIEELSDIQNDMKNLFDNMSTGTIFLDQKFLVRRFTREAAKVYRLVASDVGRQLSDIKCDLEGVDIVAQARMVLETLMPWEREVRTTNGVWYQARIQPYRTLENVIDGLVLTLSDINKRVEAELAVQEGRELAEAIVDTVREPLMILDGDLRVVTASRSFYEQFQTSTASTVGRLIYELGAGQWNTPKLRELLERVLPQNESFDDLAMEYELSRNERRTILLNARRIIRRANGEPLILLAIEVRAPIEKEGLYEREEGDTGTAQLTAAR
jgi:two-component system CheB/CheR fusion protein